MMRRCVLSQTVGNERPGRGKNRIAKEGESPEAKDDATALVALQFALGQSIRARSLRRRGRWSIED
jgi:hypothetical protein